MLLDDRIRDGQPQAGSLPHLFRREKRIENPRLHVVGHARTVVVHFEHDRVAVGVVPRAHDQRAAAVRADHGLFGIDDEIQQHLLNLVRVREHLRQAGRQRLEDVDVAQPLLVRAQRERFPHDLIEIDHRARRVALAREGQQVAHDLRGALRFAQDRFETAARLLVDRFLREPFRPGEDGCERIVQLVRHARDGLPERGELLGLEQLVIQVARLILEALALADVAHQRLDADAVRARLGVRGDLDPDRRPVGAAQPEQVVGDRSVASRDVPETPPAPADRRTVRARTGGPRPAASRRRSRTSASDTDWPRASARRRSTGSRCRPPRAPTRTIARRFLAGARRMREGRQARCADYTGIETALGLTL